MDAMERWRVLRLHVKDQVPLAALARETGISARTLQRWKQLFPQINRVLKINQLDTITDDVIEAAASILVIGN